MKLCPHGRIGVGDFFDVDGVGAIVVKGIVLIEMLQPAVDPEILGHTGVLVQSGHQQGLVDGVLGHLPIGRPFAAGDGHQTRF